MDSCHLSLPRGSPSFSSILLEAIYRSIDEGHNNEQEDQVIFHRKIMRSQQQRNNFRDTDETEILSQKIVLPRNSMTESGHGNRNNIDSMSKNSTSISSCSGYGGRFTSSSFYSMKRPKAIGTYVPSSRSEKFDAFHGYRSQSAHSQKPRHENENGFLKTKPKALKILKKAKQPISPASRLASFLNSLFSNTKKAKVSSSVGGYGTKSADASSDCSPATSFSRSCLSKTPSSRSGSKRAVRFCPVSVEVDEGCRGYGRKNLNEDEPGLRRTLENNNNDELKFLRVQESRRAVEVARHLLKNYGEDVDSNMDSGEEQDDDESSCSSSDLFELDNLSTIGIERYRHELPVYEKTHIGTNRAIANGFIP